MNLLDRPRRLRANPVMRDMIAETSVEARHLITPHFVVEGTGVKEEIGSMPGVFHVSVDKLVKEVGRRPGAGPEVAPAVRHPRRPRTPRQHAAPTATASCSGRCAR